MRFPLDIRFSIFPILLPARSPYFVLWTRDELPDTPEDERDIYVRPDFSFTRIFRAEPTWIWRTKVIGGFEDVATAFAAVLKFVERSKGRVALANHPLNLRLPENGAKFSVPVGNPESVIWDVDSSAEYVEVLAALEKNPMLSINWPMSLRVNGSNFQYPEFMDTFAAWDPVGFKRFMDFSFYMRRDLYR